MSDATCDTLPELREGANSAHTAEYEKPLEALRKIASQSVGHQFSKRTLCFVVRWGGNTDPKLAIASKGTEE